MVSGHEITWNRSLRCRCSTFRTRYYVESTVDIAVRCHETIYMESTVDFAVSCRDTISCGIIRLFSLWHSVGTRDYTSHRVNICVCGKVPAHNIMWIEPVSLRYGVGTRSRGESKPFVVIALRSARDIMWNEPLNLPHGAGTRGRTCGIKC